MKCYFIYASIPLNVYSKRINFMLNNEYDFRVKHNTMYGLYAISFKKKLVKDFLKTRVKDIYTLVEKEIDEEEKEIIANRFSDLILQKKTFYTTKEHVEKASLELVVTKNEYYNSVIEGSENYYNFHPASDLDIDYQLFNDNIINALDILGYTYEYDSSITEDQNRADHCGYSSSYGLTPCGNQQISLNHNQAGLLIYLFRFMFIGE